MSIHDHYEAARKELLDLGLRNSLLNYRHSSARGVRVQGESSVEIYDLLVRGEKEMTFVPRKGLEVDLSPHLTNARQRLEDLPKWPGKGVVDKDLAAHLKTVGNSIGKVLNAVMSLPPRVEEAIDRAVTEDNEAAGRQLLNEVEFAIHQAEGVRNRVERGREILKKPLAPEKVQILSASLEHEIDTLAREHLARVEDAAAGGALRKEWLKPLSEGELRDTRLQTNDTDRRLQRRLLNTERSARTYIEERGVNVLYLALGMLHWRDAEDPKRDLKAPLLLVPVKLQRAAVRERYKLSYTGDHIEENLSLAFKLKQDFAAELPPFPEIEDMDPKVYFEAVRQAVSGLQNWEVQDDEIYLGFFSFTKLMMYRDLDCAGWPKEEQPTEHPLLKAVLADGFNEAGSAYEDETLLDDHLPPEESHQVVDADGSQLTAILDVKDGRNMVIQGPPGTGKSQTITNLVAQALGQGKRVLFVAEKMAALEVVKRRLDTVGLGDACLEVHSHNANKKGLVDELKRTLGQGRVIEQAGAQSDMELLGSIRGKLNQYASAVNEPLAQTGYSAYEIFGELIHQQRQLKEVADQPRLQSMVDALSDLGTILNCTRAQLEERTVAVGRLESHLAKHGKPVAHPYHGAGVTLLMPSDRDRLFDELPLTLKSLHALTDAVGALQDRLGFGNQANWSDAQRLAAMARHAEEAPDLRGIHLRSRSWEEDIPVLDELLETGRDHSAVKAQHETTLIPEAWGRDVLIARSALVEHGEKWYKFIIGDYRRARTEIRALCKAGQAPKEPTELLKLTDAIMSEARLKKEIEEKQPVAEEPFGRQWRGVDSDWDKLKAVRGFVEGLRTAVRAGNVDDALITYLESAPDTLPLPGLVKAMEEAHAAWKAQAERLFELLNLEDTLRTAWLKEWAFEDQVRKLEVMIGNAERLDEQVTYNQLVETLEEAGLGWVVEGAAEWEAAPEHLVHWYRNAWFERMLHELLDSREPLRRFNQTAHTQDILRFRELDELLFLFNRIRLAARHWEGLPSMVGNGQLGILLREFEKRVRHLPIRKLITRTGRAIQAIKPVFMMSPMSIASFLPPSSVHFDLVIFDEASQVKPVDALGAILRGKQLVVVGDSKQMPPTRFFDSLGGGGDDLDDEDNRLADLESILGTMTGQRAPQRMLRWHYRSRHESLIAVSNREFYDGNLLIFPNFNPADPALGIKYHYLPDTVYERGATSSNPLEARAVAEAVFRHARECPELTLGVAAFSVKQMQAVYDEVERMRMEDNSCEEFFGAHEHEPFFVKNLENVQGDERDVIFISVGYGRDQDGKVSMNFGPLNSDGGERRLNVLITRARRRCEVFTNLRALDIDLNRTSARGVGVFRSYLQYAEAGALEGEAESAHSAISTLFEEEVAEFLRQAGHQVQMKVGTAGFFIDLAVFNANQPGSYLLGIECDGPEYNRARTARDRDRLRQQVMEGLGWQVYRLWSVEWFAHPEAEQARLLAAIEAAQRGEPVNSPRERAEESDQLRGKRLEELRSIRREATSAKLTGALSQPAYKKAKFKISTGKKDLVETPEEKRKEWITKIVEAEGPVHEDVAYARYLELAGRRTGSNNSRSFTEGLKAAQSGAPPMVWKEGEFLFSDAEQQAVVRDRRRLKNEERKLEWVADTEVDASILMAVEQSYGMEREDISIASTRLMGFDRTLEPMRVRIDAHVAALMATGALTELEGQIQIPEGGNHGG